MHLPDLLKLSAQRHGDPERVLRLVQLRQQADTTAEERSQLLWVEGLARHELGDSTGAVDCLREAARLARAAGAADAASRAYANLAISLLQLGQQDDARRARAEAERLTPASSRGAVRYLGALFEQRLGNLDRALDLYRQAEALLRDDGDRATIAGLHLNRGVLHSYRNDETRASREYAAAETIAAEEGLTILQAMAAHNLGFSLGRLGATIAALRSLDQARERYESLGYEPRQLPVLHSDHAEVLLAAGLNLAALRAAREAVAALERADNQLDLSEAQLLLARAARVTGAHAEARRAATLAARGFRRSGRPSWAALATYEGVLVAAAAVTASGAQPASSLIERCLRAARRLEQAGRSAESLDARLWAARLAAGRGDVELARSELTLTGGQRRRLGLSQRLNRLQAVALIALADDDLGAARRAVLAGLDDADRSRGTFGATEARVQAAGLAADLAATGVEIAFRTRRPAAVFRAAERTRATALHRPELSPAAGSPIERELRQLRQVRSARPGPRRPAGLRGDGPASPDPAEERIAHLALRVPATPRRRDAPSIRAVQSGLEGATLVEYVERAGRLHAVVITPRRAELIDLGPTGEVTAAAHYLTAAVHRLLRRGLDPGRRLPGSVTRSAQDLDRLLLAPLELERRGGDAVIVPTGALFRLPWTALPTLSRIPFAIAPSADLWLRAARQPERPRRRVLLVHGPALPGAADEVARLHRLHPAAVVLSGADAGCERALAEMERVDLAHIAAHGTFRTDNPMFSSIGLHDGELTIYDLEGLRSVPATVILTACNVGAAVVTETDELLGTAFTLLSMGVRTVVAPVAPIPDGFMTAYVTSLHRALLRGHPVRRAHCLAVASLDPDDPVAATAAACFVPVGAG